MNERIKQLAEKAGAVYSNDHAVSLLDDEIEKFAELIVRECARINFSNIVGIDPEDDAAVGRAIKKHFGVGVEE